MLLVGGCRLHGPDILRKKCAAKTVDRFHPVGAEKLLATDEIIKFFGNSLGKTVDVAEAYLT